MSEEQRELCNCDESDLTGLCSVSGGALWKV